MKSQLPVRPPPTMAQRAQELRSLNLPGARISFVGRQLQLLVSLSPGQFGRVYECLFTIKPDGVQPDVIVLTPDLSLLGGTGKIPHTYAYDGKGTRLCLWWPKGRQWVPDMKLTDTFIPWTAEWLHFFELWLKTGDWLGGGEHPSNKPRRWPRPRLTV